MSTRTITRQKLLDAGASLISETRSLPTSAAICRRAELTTGAFYGLWAGNDDYFEDLRVSLSEDADHPIVEALASLDSSDDVVRAVLAFQKWSTASSHAARI